MSVNEMTREISTDFKVLNAWLEGQKVHEVRRWVGKQKLPAWYCCDWLSRNGNKWYVMWLIEDIKVGGGLVTFTTLNTEYGSYVMRPQVTRGGFILVFYLPHFFRRYRERMNLGADMKPMQVIRRYLKRNVTGKDTGNDGEVNICTDEGIGLGGYMSGRTCLLKTFIPYSLAKGEQVDRFAEGKKIQGTFGAIHNEYRDVSREMNLLKVDGLDLSQD